MKRIEQKLYCRKCWGEIDETGSVCTMCGAENQAFEGVADEEFERLEEGEKPMKMPPVLDGDALTAEEEYILDAKPVEQKNAAQAEEKSEETARDGKRAEATAETDKKGEGQAWSFFEEVRRTLDKNGYMLSQSPCDFKFQNKGMGFKLVAISKGSVAKNEPEIIVVSEFDANQICTAAAVSKIEAKCAFLINSKELRQMIDEVREEIGAKDGGFFGFFKKKTDYVNFLDNGQVELVVISKSGFSDDAIENVKNSPFKFRLWHEKENEAEEVNKRK